MQQPGSHHVHHSMCAESLMSLMKLSSLNCQVLDLLSLVTNVQYGVVFSTAEPPLLPCICTRRLSRQKRARMCLKHSRHDRGPHSSQHAG